MPSFGIGVKKEKKDKVTPSGYTEDQIKAQKKASNVKSVGAIGIRRKRMEEILGE